MDVYIFGYYFNFDSFWDFFIEARNWMHGLPVIYQILILVGLVALTVGSFSLVYYIVKAVLQLVFEIVRILFKFIRSLFIPRKHHRSYHYRYDRPRKMNKPSRRHMRPPVAPRPPTPPTAPVRPTAPTQPTQTLHSIPEPSPTTQRPQATSTMAPTSIRNNVVKFSQLLHCPNCGSTFTNEMMRILSDSESVYCESCGNKLEYELQ
ncbi:MAG: hypothetical protein ACTSPA_05805 [Promethearchaeota archaeon]